MANETLTLKKQSEQTWSNETVSVASKLSFPLKLQLFRKVKRTIQAHGGTSVEEIFEPILSTKSKPSSFVIRGNAYNKYMGDNGKQIIGGYAITPGIPKDFWDEWYAQQESHDAIQNQMIFAHKETASVAAQAKENEKLSGGIMDRLDRANLPKQGQVKIESNERHL